MSNMKDTSLQNLVPNYLQGFSSRTTAER